MWNNKGNMYNVNKLRAMEVLHIANRDSSGEIVLNDEKLLELIMHYPYLYSPRVQPYDDLDYREWTWKQIATSFNRNYENASNAVVFGPTDLQERWKVLQPMIISLSKLFDLRNVPGSLRGIVIKIGSQLPDNPTSTQYTPPTYSAAQMMIHENIPMVERLSFEQRRSLEAEIMEFMLSCEIETKGTIPLDAPEKQRVDQECADFLKAIQWDISPPAQQIAVVSGASPEAILPDDGSDATSSCNDLPMAPIASLRSEAPSPHSPTPPPLLCTVEITEGPMRRVSVTEKPTTRAQPSTTPVMVKIKRERLLKPDSLKRKRRPSVAATPETDTLIAPVVEEDPLLKPLEPKRWVPLELASTRVRSCLVRLKRIPRNIMNLAISRQIKRERNHN